MSLKDKKRKERIEKGNEKAAMVAAYLNHRFSRRMNLIQADLHDDIHLKLDYKNTIVKDGESKTSTYQIKVRDQREDIIHEYCQFKETGTKEYRVMPGRDYLCQADYYICKPRVFEPERIDITRTSDVKKLTDEAIKEWQEAEGKDSEFTDENIDDWWKRARFSDGKQTLLFTSKEGTQLYFKLDEGSDSKMYGKILSFIQPETLKNREDCYLRTIYLQEGEVLDRPKTWRKYKK